QVRCRVPTHEGKRLAQAVPGRQRTARRFYLQFQRRVYPARMQEGIHHSSVPDPCGNARPLHATGETPRTQGDAEKKGEAR
ncbi:MAG TPA: hypothetical protein PKA06_04450, partial [Gemmatales bacterium]|nr:hypothetical protein [Gemmatales bacterium]